MSALELRNVSKFYGHVEAVQSMSLEVDKGELLALIGPSGCGKTSTCKMIAGLEEITSGDLLFSGKRMNDLASEERNIAMVFEDYALYPRMDVYDNVAFPLKVRNTPKDELRQRVEEILEKIELTDVRSARVQDLSGGQQQRVSIARALVREPAALILDEPLSHLDVNLKARLRSEIRLLQQQLGLTSVLVTHDQAEAMAMADRVAVMNFGELRQCDAPHVVYDQPADVFVAGFIGEPPINFVKARIDQSQAQPKLVAPGVTAPLDPSLAKVTRNGQEVIAGIRPEHISVTRPDQVSSGEGTVYFDEWFGAFQAVTLDLDRDSEHRITLLADAESDFPLGSSVSFSVDPKHVTLFDPETELNLLNTNRSGAVEEAVAL